MIMRPHHALCIILFLEEGHSVAYAAVMQEYIAFLNDNPETQLELTTELDGICLFCPFSHDEECEKADEVDVSDRKILRHVSMEFGETVGWVTLRERLIDEIIQKERLSEVCAGCKFLPRCDRQSELIINR